MIMIPSGLVGMPASHLATLYGAVLDSLPDAVLVTDQAGKILHLNAAAIRLLGKSRGRLQERMLPEVMTILDADTRRPVMDPLGRFLARSARTRSDEFDLLLRDGTEIPVDDSCSVLHKARHGTEGFVLVLRDATALRKLTLDASQDPLTRLANRDELERRLKRVLETLRPGDAHALLYMDLDHFKQVNDTHGHAAGDAVLRRVAETFRPLIRERDTLARMGGDEFALLLEHCPITLAGTHARILANALSAQEFFLGGTRFHLSVSIGTVPISPGQTSASVLAAADDACYAAKHSSFPRGTPEPPADPSHPSA